MIPNSMFLKCFDALDQGWGGVVWICRWAQWVQSAGLTTAQGHATTSCNTGRELAGRASRIGCVVRSYRTAKINLLTLVNFEHSSLFISLLIDRNLTLVNFERGLLFISLLIDRNSLC